MASSSEPTVPKPADGFESWFLHRVAEAVEGNEVSAGLPTDLHAAIAEVRTRPPEARDALALMDLGVGQSPRGSPHGPLGDLAGPTDGGSGAVPGASSRRGWSSSGKHTIRSNTEETMAKALDRRHAVPLEDVVLAQAFQREALMNVLERQGLLTKAEVLAEIKALQANTPTAR